MIAYYRLPGVLAAIALIFYTLVVYAVFRVIHVTLTLAGVAAFILSIGMAVDANILIFERMKEEIRAGKTLGPAIEAGFNRAWSSILDSNVASLLVAGWLYWQGTTVVTRLRARPDRRRAGQHVQRRHGHPHDAATRDPDELGPEHRALPRGALTDVRHRRQAQLVLRDQRDPHDSRPALHHPRRPEAVDRLHRRDRVGGPLRRGAVGRRDDGRARGSRIRERRRHRAAGRIPAHPNRADRSRCRPSPPSRRRPDRSRRRAARAHRRARRHRAPRRAAPSVGVDAAASPSASASPSAEPTASPKRPRCRSPRAPSSPTSRRSSWISSGPAQPRLRADGRPAHRRRAHPQLRDPHRHRRALHPRVPVDPVRLPIRHRGDRRAAPRRAPRRRARSRSSGTSSSWSSTRCS